MADPKETDASKSRTAVTNRETQAGESRRELGDSGRDGSQEAASSRLLADANAETPAEKYRRLEQTRAASDSGSEREAIATSDRLRAARNLPPVESEALKHLEHAVIRGERGLNSFNMKEFRHVDMDKLMGIMGEDLPKCGVESKVDPGAKMAVFQLKAAEGSGLYIISNRSELRGNLLTADSEGTIRGNSAEMGLKLKDPRTALSVKDGPLQVETAAGNSSVQSQQVPSQLERIAMVTRHPLEYTENGSTVTVNPGDKGAAIQQKLDAQANVLLDDSPDEGRRPGEDTVIETERRAIDRARDRLIENRAIELLHGDRYTRGEFVRSYARAARADLSEVLNGTDSPEVKAERLERFNQQFVEENGSKLSTLERQMLSGLKVEVAKPGEPTGLCIKHPNGKIDVPYKVARFAGGPSGLEYQNRDSATQAEIENAELTYRIPAEDFAKPQELLQEMYANGLFGTKVLLEKQETIGQSGSKNLADAVDRRKIGKVAEAFDAADEIVQKEPVGTKQEAPAAVEEKTAAQSKPPTTESEKTAVQSEPPATESEKTAAQSEQPVRGEKSSFRDELIKLEQQAQEAVRDNLETIRVAKETAPAHLHEAYRQREADLRARLEAGAQAVTAAEAGDSARLVGIHTQENPKALEQIKKRTGGDVLPSAPVEPVEAVRTPQNREGWRSQDLVADSLSLEVEYSHARRHTERGQTGLDSMDRGRYGASVRTLTNQGFDGTTQAKVEGLNKLVQKYTSERLMHNQLARKAEVVVDGSLASGGALEITYKGEKIQPFNSDEKYVRVAKPDGTMRALPIADIEVKLRISQNSLEQANSESGQRMTSEVCSSLYFQLHQLHQAEYRLVRAQAEGVDLSNPSAVNEFMQRECAASNLSADHLQYQLDGRTLAEGQPVMKGGPLSVDIAKPLAAEMLVARVVTAVDTDGRLRIYALDSSSTLKEVEATKELLEKSYDRLSETTQQELDQIRQKKNGAQEQERQSLEIEERALVEKLAKIQTEKKLYSNDEKFRSTFNRRFASAMQKIGSKVRGVSGGTVTMLFLSALALEAMRSRQEEMDNSAEPGIQGI